MYNKIEGLPMTNNKVTINYKGQSVDCYDTLTEESNIQIACSDRLDAEFIDNWNYGTDEAFTNWTEAVHYLIDLDRFKDIEELTAC